MASKEDTQGNIGKILEGKVARDAIHIAVLPVITHDYLKAGQHIGVKHGVTTIENPVGIVDPFLDGFIGKGSQIYLFLYPNTITSLNHQWTHPSIPDEGVKPTSTKEESEAWLRDFIAKADCPPYEELIAAATGKSLPDVDGYGAAYNNDGEYLFFSGRDAHGDIPPEFWEHIEVVTGVKVPQSKRAPSFSCSC